MTKQSHPFFIWLLTLTMTACQMIPPGIQTQTSLAGGFQIQSGVSKPDLKPILSCVSQGRDGSLLAHFSYENTLGKTVSIPVGEKNKFLENPGWGQKSDSDQKEDKTHENEKESNHSEQSFSIQSNSSKPKQNEKNSSQNLNTQQDIEKEKQGQHEQSLNKEQYHQSNRRDYQDRGQITDFPPGAGSSWPQSTFSVAFTQERLTWQLGNRSVTAYAQDLSQRCNEEKITVAEHTAPRKTMLLAQTINLTQTQQVFNFSFQASEIADLRRRIAINLINGPDGSARVNDLRIYLNKQPLLALQPNASFLKSELPNMIAEIYNTQFGNNNLELEISGPVGAQIRFSIEGFLRAAYIPKAAHSAIDSNELIRKAPTHKGVIGIKFMEGLKVRLGQATNQWERFSDQTGISLLPLQALIAYHQISEIVPALPGSVEERDTMEQRAESKTGHEAPNQNLFYYLYFDENKDVWDMVDRLSILPFIEEAFPMFVFSSPQATTSSGLAPFIPDEVKPSGGLSGSTTPVITTINPFPTPVPNSLWLECSRILNQSSAPTPRPCPSASPGADPIAGAWDITQGSPSVKIAAIEHGFIKNHEELGNVKQLVDISPGNQYTDFEHATKTMGVLGATKDSTGRGSIGVAHGASVYHIWAWDNQLNSPSLCKGTGYAKCNRTVDALEYAKKEHMNAVLVEVDGGGFTPGTVEHLDPPVRTQIQQNMIPAGISVILPAGNRACEDIKDSNEFNQCTALFPAGKNIKAVTVAESYPDMHGCVPPNPWVNLAPFGPFIAGALAIGYINCVKDNPPTIKYRFSKTGPMEDSGSIIVGALKVDGSGMVPPTGGTSTLPYNHGKSIPSSDGLSTEGGHGTDIAGPSEHIWTTAYDPANPNKINHYGNFGGTSGASPVIAGVVALMLSVNPTLTPQVIRKILRETQQSLPSGEDISGMVNAYEAVKTAQSLPGGIGGGGFSSKSLLSPPAGVTPAGFGLNVFYDPNFSTPLTVRAGDTIGFFMANARTRNISIEIQGKNAVVKAISDDLISMTVPADLVVGNLNVLFKSDQGSFQIDNLLNYTSPYPEVVKFSKPTIFANGGDIVDAYITVKDQNGQPAPDGTSYYIHLMPTHIGLYPDLRMIDPETQQEYGGKWSSYEQVFSVKNGTVHIQVKLSEAIAPYTYTYDWANNIPNALTWPHVEAPSFQVQVCTPAYSSYKPGYGYYCGQQLFPQTGNTQDGRLYAIHAYSVDPQINYVTAGSGRQLYKIHNIKDILGNPVPVGTVLYLNNTYYGQISTTEGGDIARGAVVKTPGELEFAYEPISRVSCTWFAGTQDIAYITPNGASGDPLSWMIGSPIYFKYVLC